MRVSAIPIVIIALGTVPNSLERELQVLEIGEQIKANQATALLRLARYWEESWSQEEACCHSDSIERPSANIQVKTCKMYNDDK